MTAKMALRGTRAGAKASQCFCVRTRLRFIVGRSGNPCNVLSAAFSRGDACVIKSLRIFEAGLAFANCKFVCLNQR